MSNGRNVVPFQSPQSQMPAVGTRQGMWVWNGCDWVCDTDCCDGRTGPWFPPPVTQPPWYPGINGGVTFSATPPPCPIRGHFWWNGTTLSMFDGAAWVAIGPGAGPGPGPTPGGNTTESVFAIGSPTDISPVNTGALAWGILPLTTTPTVDTALGWNPTTKQYMPQKAGFYQFFTTQWVLSTNGGNTVIKNDMGSLPDLTAANVIAVAAIGGSVGDYLTGSGISYMNGTTDFVRLWGFSGDGIYRIISSNVPIIRAYLMA